MLTARYEVPLVLVSILVAILASYTALSLAGRVTRSEGAAARRWIAGGALAMGTGIWSMHFIGMLAFRLPIPVGYDLGITLLSLMLAVAVSGLALWQASQPRLPAGRLAAGGVLMGAGINAMHYTGMAAMRMAPGIDYDPWLFAASVAIAILASCTALWIAFKLRQEHPHAWLARMGAAVVMGFAIVGMHYTGMAAAHYPADSICMAAKNGFSQDGLAILVIAATFAVLSIALLTSVYDARLDARSQILAISEATSEERKILLARERTAREQAERMNMLKDEFLATLSHELRTPLSAILGWSQMLRRSAANDAVLSKGLETIERNARAQAKLIDDLLDMSRIVSGKVQLNMQQLDPAFIVEAALDSVRPAALAKRITITQSLDPQAGPVAADPDRLQQVLWNLLSNAVKFTPEGGGIEVTLEKAGAAAVIRVADSGIGIAADFLPHVFDRFRQADASTTRRYGGLGLGLAIVRQLVELQGGTVCAASEGMNKGACFVLSLPLLQVRAGQAACAPIADADAVTHAGGGDFPVADLSGITVLAIDDEPDALDLLARMLGEWGASVLTAATAIDALWLVRTEQPDLIISDIGMPDMDGYELMRRVRLLGSSGGADIPAIALTAFTGAEDGKRAAQAGFTCHMSKPVDPGALADIAARLARKGGHPTPALAPA